MEYISEKVEDAGAVMLIKMWEVAQLQIWSGEEGVDQSISRPMQFALNSTID